MLMFFVYLNFFGAIVHRIMTPVSEPIEQSIILLFINLVIQCLMMSVIATEHFFGSVTITVLSGLGLIGCLNEQWKLFDLGLLVRVVDLIGCITDLSLQCLTLIFGIIVFVSMAAFAYMIRVKQIDAMTLTQC